MKENFNNFIKKQVTLVKLELFGESAIEKGRKIEGFFNIVEHPDGPETIRATIYNIDNFIGTSKIYEIVEKTDNSVIFRTETSIYKLELK
jgi:hypothetical protein